MSRHVDWKSIVVNLVFQHEKWGTGAVTLDGKTPYAEVDKRVANLTPDSECYFEKGAKLTPKKVRAWLWEQRKSRKVRRATAVIWSVYDKVNSVSYVGIGALTKPEVAVKISERQALQETT